jgi:DNA-directed RNA polymerase specialized sigma24 family protein
MQIPKETIEEIIKLNKQGLSQKEIAKIVGIPQASISRKVGHLLTNKNLWTSEEVDYLVNNFGLYSIERISKNLNKSIRAVRVKAVRLGLGSTHEANGALYLKDIARAFKTDSTHIKKKWLFKLGLPYSYKKLTSVSRNCLILPEDLWEFLKNNPEICDLSKLEENALGKEPTWVREKRKQDYQRKDKRHHQTWTKEQDNLLRMYYKSGKSHEEIGLILKRSKSSIYNRIKRLNLPRRNIQIDWKEIEVKMLIDMKLKGFTDEEVAEELGRGLGSVRWKRRKLIEQGKLIWYKGIEFNG